MLLALSCIHQASKNVLARQLIKVKENFLKRHPGREPSQHINHRDARIAHAGLAKALFRIDRDSGGETIHGRIVNLW